MPPELALGWAIDGVAGFTLALNVWLIARTARRVLELRARERALQVAIGRARLRGIPFPPSSCMRPRSASPRDVAHRPPPQE